MELNLNFDNVGPEEVKGLLGVMKQQIGLVAAMDPIVETGEKATVVEYSRSKTVMINNLYVLVEKLTDVILETAKAAAEAEPEATA